MTVDEGTYYPAHSCSGSAEETTKLMQSYLMQRFGFGHGGIYNCRNIAGTSTLSVHGTGRAGDLMTGTGRATRESLFVSEQMRLFSKEMGLQGVIHDRHQWFCNRSTGWRDYNGSNPHTDHIHYERKPGVVFTPQQIVGLFQGPGPSGNMLSAGAVVKLGSEGAAVRHVQTSLRSHGFSHVVVDGEAGPITIGAVKTFQTLCGIGVDGIAGRITQGRLR